MRGRTILVLLVALIVLAAAAWTFDWSRKRATQPSGRPLFTDLATERIDRIRIAPAEEDTVLLAKRDGSWFVESEGGYAAEPDKIEDILEQLPKFYADQVVSTNPENQSIFQVDSTGTRVWIWQDGRQIGDFIVGKPGSDLLSTYIRPAGSDRVLQVGAYLPSLFQGQKTWRQERIFSLDQEEIEAYEYSSPTRGELRLVRNEEGAWMLEKPFEVPADGSRVPIPLGTFARLRTLDWADTLGPEEAGTAADTTWIRATLADGSIHKLRIGLPTERNRVYAQKEGEQQLFVIPIGGTNTMLAPAETFIQREEMPEE